jgi:Lipase maturation factor
MFLIRLDWQMWFAALGSYHHNPWFISLIYRLLKVYHYTNESLINKSINQSTNQSIYQPINLPTNQSINQSTNQQINRPINQFAGPA